INPFHVADEESVGWHRAEPVGLRVGVLDVGRLNGGVFPGAAALVENENIAEFHILDGVPWNAGNDACLVRSAMRDDDVADVHASQFANRDSFRAPHAAAQAEKQGDIGDIAHCDITDGNVFQQRAVHRLQRDSPAIVNDTVRYRDISESPVGLRPQLDSPVAGRFVVRPNALERRVKQRAFLVAAGYVTVRDCHVVGGSGEAEPIATLQADAVVPRGVYAAMGDAYVAATIDVDAVAVGVDLEIVDREIVNTGCQNCEMPPVQDRHVAKDDVMAILQADRLVPNSSRKSLIPPAAAQALSPNAPRPDDADILDALTPDEAVVPVTVSEVLILIPGVRLRRIVAAFCAFCRRLSGHDRRARTQIEFNVALQMDRVAEIGSRGEAYRSATSSGGRFDSLVNGRR